MSNTRRPNPLASIACALLLCAAFPARAGDPGLSCADCHGKDGASTESEAPVIGGLSDQYLTDAMAAYRDKKRPCLETQYRAGDTKRPKTTMCEIAAKLSADDTLKVVRGLSAKPFVKAKQKFDAAKAATGKKIHDAQCEKCHAEGGGSADDDAGILAGQWMPYTKATLADMMGGKRPNPEKMKVKTDPLKAEEVEALLHYYASQQ